MSPASDHDERIAKMTFASVYPHYLAKVEKKGRTKEELHQVVTSARNRTGGTICESLEQEGRHRETACAQSAGTGWPGIAAVSQAN
jgi:hypothetical protein